MKYAPEFEPIAATTKESFDKIWSLPVAEMKEFVEKNPSPIPEDAPKDLEITHETVKVSDGTDIGIRVYRPNSTTTTTDKKKVFPLVIVAHGGGWVVGTHNNEDAMSRVICATADAVVVSVDYRMAPEFPYPYAVNDTYDVFVWAQNNPNHFSIDPKKIIVGGSSAGANIAAVMALRAREEGRDGIIGQFLNFPPVVHPNHFPHDKHNGTSYEENKDAPVLPVWIMEFFWKSYYPEAGTDVYVSPLLAKSLAGLPPAYIIVATIDPLRDDGLAYAKELQSAG